MVPQVRPKPRFTSLSEMFVKRSLCLAWCPVIWQEYLLLYILLWVKKAIKCTYIDLLRNDTSINVSQRWIEHHYTGTVRSVCAINTLKEVKESITMDCKCLCSLVLPVGGLSTNHHIDLHGGAGASILISCLFGFFMFSHVCGPPTVWKRVNGGNGMGLDGTIPIPNQTFTVDKKTALIWFYSTELVWKESFRRVIQFAHSLIRKRNLNKKLEKLRQILDCLLNLPLCLRGQIYT